MKNIVNDEIEIPFGMMTNRTPTQNLRFRDVGSGRMLLEQLWVSNVVGIGEEWVPVSMA